MLKEKLSRPDYLAGITALVLILLGIIQILFGELWAKSVALTANGIDCIGDGFVSATVWAGLLVYERPADDRFHFGYYKIENLASIAAAIVMMILAGYIVFRSYNQLIDPHPVKLPLIGIELALFAAFVALGLGWYKHKKGSGGNLGSVKLDAFNTVKDGIASGLTVVALIAASFGFIIADAIAGFIIAGIIVSIGIVAIKESSYMLIDACDNNCIIQGDLIRRITKNIDEIEEAHLLRLRRTGPVIQGELEIILPGDMTISRFYEIKEQIISEAKQKIPELDRLSIVAHPEDIKK
jgi:cation diffusion facilitator family transporter